MILISFFILLYLQLNVVNAITLNALGFSYLEESQFYTNVVRDFNTYAEKNNLNIKIDFNILTTANSTRSINDFISFLEAMHNRHSTKYDLIFYEFSELKNFNRYFLDLSKWLPEEHIKMFDSEILSKRCSMKNKLIGIPMTLSYTVLYYNKKLLEKYEKRVPKTWDELIDTSLEIKTKENKLGNTNLSEYNGLFSEKNAGSYFEVIYSFRNSTNSPYPDIKSKETFDAFKTVMKMKNKLSSGNEFNLLDVETVNKILQDSSIFLKFWVLAEPLASKIDANYGMAPLPGGNENISTASINGYNVGINKEVEIFDERREAAIKVIKYITSKEMQKQYFLNGDIVTAIPSLYDDDEICQKRNCELFKNIQSLLDIDHTYGFYDKYKYEEKYGKLAASYLFEKKDLSEVLNKIEDITKIYYISMDPDDNYIGLIIIIIVSIFSTLMLFSLIFTFMENFQPFFENLSIDSWIILISGLILILCSALTKLGKLSDKKCHLELLLNSIGISLYLIIILYELIINFPEDNKFFRWVRKHKYLFLLFFLSIDFGFNGLSIINPFSVQTKIVEDSHNYQICKMTTSLGKSMITSSIFEKIILFTFNSFLIFSEWNIKRTFYEIRFILLALYSNALLAFIYLFLNFVSINYYSQFIIQEGVLIFMSISSYIILYGYKLYSAFMKKQNVKLKFINSINKNFIDNSDCFNKSPQEDYITKTATIVEDNNTETEIENNEQINIEQLVENNPSSFFTKMLNYHYSRKSFNNVSESPHENNYLSSINE